MKYSFLIVMTAEEQTTRKGKPFFYYSAGVLNLLRPRLPKVKIKIRHLPPDRMNEKIRTIANGGGCAGRRPKIFYSIYSKFLSKNQVLEQFWALKSIWVEDFL